jgi:hypothetical protein
MEPRSDVNQSRESGENQARGTFETQEGRERGPNRIVVKFAAWSNEVRAVGLNGSPGQGKRWNAGRVDLDGSSTASEKCGDSCPGSWIPSAGRSATWQLEASTVRLKASRARTASQSRNPNQR